MSELEKILTEKTKDCLQNLYGESVPENQISFQQTRKEFEGDITLVVFPFTRFSKANPEETGKQIGSKLKELVVEVVDFNVIKGFLNLVIADNYWLQFTADIDNKYGLAKADSGKTVIVEYSSPNTNKPIHLGHIRNNLLGYSVSEILKANGHKVIKTQIINDRGIHICKSMLAWQKWGNGETPESAGMKGDHLVGKYYVEFDKQYRKEIKELVSAGKEKEEAEKQAPLLLEAQEMLRKWEAKDPEVYALWEKMNGWVYDGFEKTYKELGVNFDKLYYESNTWEYGKEKVMEGLEKGIFYQKEDGSVWVNLEPDGLDHKLLLRSDGTAVYMTQDIGTAIMRYEDYPTTNQMIYTVGNEQDYHFKVLFLILDKLGYSWAKSCYHLSYGMVDLPSGKMKSREGTVVDADELMAEMTATARRTSEELGKIEDVTNPEELYKTIGLGALKYFILKVDPKKRMLFNPEESIDFAGNTGPFIQYTYARIQSVLRKADVKQPEFNAREIELNKAEKEVIKSLYNLPTAVKQAGEEYSPALLANYTYELVKAYNHFYQTTPILKDENENALQFRLQLSAVTAQVIRTATGILGINVPDRM